MEDVCEGVHKKAALRFMNTFVQIYREDPDICDIDALIRFIKKEGVISNKKMLEQIDRIPGAAKDSYDLHLRENAAAFTGEFAPEQN